MTTIYCDCFRRAKHHEKLRLSQPREKNLGPPWKANTFKPDPVILSQPAYKPEISREDWDDERYIKQYIDDDFLKIMVDKTNQTYVHSVSPSF